MTACAHLQAIVGLSNTQLAEEDIGHRRVVVLACVDKHVLELRRPTRERRSDWGDLHEVRSRPHDRQDLPCAVHAKIIRIGSMTRSKRARGVCKPPSYVASHQRM